MVLLLLLLTLILMFAIVLNHRHVENYSVEGLRCLFVGAANIREKDYLRWHEEYEKASTDLKENERRRNSEVKGIRLKS